MATLTIDLATRILGVSADFSGLLAGTTVSHIHCCVSPPENAPPATQVPTLEGFPVGVTSGSYSHTFDTTLSSTYNPAFITSSGGTPLSAEATLFAGIQAGDAYFNIHATAFPSGEIKGVFQPAGVPEPGALSMMLVDLGAIALGRLRHHA